ncbi:MAG: LamG domain-containing protein [Myxococcota bacterium]
MHARSILGLALLMACQQPTEVRVVIDAPELLRPQVGSVQVEVFDDDDQSVLMATRMPNDTGWPITALLEPRGGDRSRGYRVEVRALSASGGDGATLLASETVEADGYASGVETRNVLLGCSCTGPYADCVLNDAPAYYFPLEQGRCALVDRVGGLTAAAESNCVECPDARSGECRHDSPPACPDRCSIPECPDRCSPRMPPAEPLTGVVGAGLALFGPGGNEAGRIDPDTPNGLFADSFSVELWFRSLMMNPRATSVGMFIYQERDTDTSPWEGFELSEQDGEITVRGIPGNESGEAISVLLPPDRGQLRHFVVTVEKTAESSGIATVYVDGVQRARGPYPGTFDDRAGGEFGGHRGRYSGAEFDELAVYTRALRPREVLNHWLVGRNGCRR